MFDLGLSRTTVRFVADSIARRGDRLREIILASVLSQAAFGIVAGLVLFLIAPFLVHHVFNVPAASSAEALAMFRVLGLHIPVLLTSAALRAALEGAQRFDITSAIRIPGSVAAVAIPAFGAAGGASLPQIIWMLLAVRVVLVLASAAAVRSVLIPGRWSLPKSFHTIKELFSYSGWVAVSAALGPALGSFERFVTGAVVGIAGLGFYTGAAEAATRFLLIPATAFAALLPALSQVSASGGPDRALSATRAARRQLAALLLPLCAALFIFAPIILDRWLGVRFGAAAGTALRILSVGVFFGGLAHLPLALLYGAGRPDLPAKIHIGEVLVYLPFTYVLVKTWGISGAGLAWATRCVADFLLYELVTARAIGWIARDADESRRTRLLGLLALILFALFFAAARVAPSSPAGAVGLVAFALLLYVFAVWLRVLSPEERRAWVGMISIGSARA